MLNAIIAWSLRNRGVVLIAALVVAIYGTLVASRLPVDVFPDLNRPTVTVMTEAEGLAPEEVEILVSFPIESLVNGATDVIRVRSASSIGFSIVWVEFDWGTDIFRARQIVSEKLTLAGDRLPEGVTPVLAPISSIMGEILLLGMRSEDGSVSADEVRVLADWSVRPRLLAVPGVSQVTVMGGGVQEIQVTTTPERLVRYGVGMDDVLKAVEGASTALGGGFLLAPTEESLIRIKARVTRPEDLRRAVVKAGEPAPVLLEHVADVQMGIPVLRGDGSVNAEPAVILSVQKQPGTDTIALTERLQTVFDDLDVALPESVQIDRSLFRQADFIQRSIDHVVEAIRDGGIWVVVVLVVFLWNVRTSIVTLSALPLSILVTALVFEWMGISLNTMTLGGIAIAVGELVDDALVDVENVYRRLRENRALEEPQPVLRVVYFASAEIRNSIVYATAIVVLVVFPLFALTGLEGRMFAPLGIAYLTTLLASLAVALTVTPVMAAFVMSGGKSKKAHKDPFVLRWLKRADAIVIRFALRRPLTVLAGTSVGVILSVGALLQMGGEFLPPFAEGTLTVNLVAEPGTTLAESNRLGALAERMLIDIPDIAHTSRRTGRAELDEHAAGVNSSEIEVSLREDGRSRDVVMAAVREQLAHMAGVAVTVGQPISHRLDHIMSGVRAQVAIKVFGNDLATLRNLASIVADTASQVEGVVDLRIEPQVEIPEVHIAIRREEVARLGLVVAEVAEVVETAMGGRTVGEALDGQRTIDMVVWLAPEARNDLAAIEAVPISLPEGGWVPLGRVARVTRATGPNTINRENVKRRIVVSCNVQGRDLVGTVEDVRDRVNAELAGKLPGDAFVQYGGQFEAQQQGQTRLLGLACAAVVGILLLLIRALGSWRAALQCLVNIPLAALGGVIALLITASPSPEALAAASFWEWPLVYVKGASVSLATWIGFITVTGIVSRNGIMMISHYIHLMRYEGEEFTEQMIVRGTLERLAPVIMTTLTTCIGLVPLALGAGEPGTELLHPLAIVVIGGLTVSALLDQVVTPALFYRFGRKVYAEVGDDEEELPIPKGL